MKHKLLKPIVCRVDVQILLFENEDQNYLISIFFNGFKICWYVVLHKKSNLYYMHCVITGILEETLVISWYYM